MEAGKVVECRRGKGEGDGEVVLGVWKWREDVYWEAFCCAGYVCCGALFFISFHLPVFPYHFFPVSEGAEEMLILMRFV